LQTAYIELYDDALRLSLRRKKSPADLWKFDSSADNGPAAYGAFGPYAAYYVELRNGEGYKSPEENKGKVHSRLRLKILKPFRASMRSKGCSGRRGHV
jgi:hypothetical protein